MITTFSQKNHQRLITRTAIGMVVLLAVMGSITACTFAVPATPEAGTFPTEHNARDASLAYLGDIRRPADDLEMNSESDSRFPQPSMVHEQNKAIVRIGHLEEMPWVPVNVDNHPFFSAGLVKLGDQVPIGVVEDELIVTAPNFESIESMLSEYRLSVKRAVDLGVDDIIYVLIRNDEPLTETEANRMLQSAGVLDELEITVSSRPMLTTLVIYILESLRGRRIGLNPILSPASLNSPSAGREVPENNAHNDTELWAYLSADGPHKYDVTNAWARLNQANVGNNEVPIAVIDTGFSITPDLETRISLYDDSAVAPPPHAPRQGTVVAGTIAAASDDNYGVVGIAAPVAHIRAYQLVEPTLLGAVETMRRAVNEGARVVNLSWTGTTPIFGLMGPTLHPLASVTRAMSESVVLISSAGNAGRDITDQATLQVPCSLPEVLCIGGMSPVSDQRNDRSNHSGGQLRSGVDLFAPFLVFGTPDADTPIEYVSGTAFSAAYVSGTAGLAFGANPDLEADEVRRILLETASDSRDQQVGAVVSPGRALQHIIGNLPPVINNVFVQGDTEDIGPLDPIEFVVDTNDLDTPDECRVEWYSDQLGHLGSGHHLSTVLNSYGTHVVTVEVSDREGLTTTSSLQVLIIDHDPVIEMVHPRMGTLIDRQSPTVFSARAVDIDLEPAELPCDQIEWFLIPPNGYFEAIGIGCNTVVPAMEPGLGFLRLELRTPDGQDTWLVHRFEVQ